MTSYRDEAHLDYILRSLRKLRSYFSELAPGEIWSENEMLKDAVSRVLQTMAESCGKLSSETKSLASEVDWKDIVGFRNVLAHDYLGDINFSKVTEIILKHLPQLEQSISRIYKELYDRNEF